MLQLLQLSLFSIGSKFIFLITSSQTLTIIFILIPLASLPRHRRKISGVLASSLMPVSKSCWLFILKCVQLSGTIIILVQPLSSFSWIIAVAFCLIFLHLLYSSVAHFQYSSFNKLNILLLEAMQWLFISFKARTKILIYLSVYLYLCLYNVSHKNCA